MVTGEPTTVFSVRTDAGEVAVSVTRGLAVSAGVDLIDTQPIPTPQPDDDVTVWTLESRAGVPVGDNNTVLVGLLPGISKGKVGGPFADFFATPRDLTNDIVSFSIRMRESDQEPNSGFAATARNLEQGPDSEISAAVVLIDEDGDSCETPSEVLTEDFETIEVDVGAQPCGGALTVDLTRILQLALLVTASSSGPVVGMQFEVTDPAIIPEPGGTASAVSAWLALALLQRRTRRCGTRAERG